MIFNRRLRLAVVAPALTVAMSSACVSRLQSIQVSVATAVRPRYPFAPNPSLPVRRRAGGLLYEFASRSDVVLRPMLIRRFRFCINLMKILKLSFFVLSFLPTSATRNVHLHYS